ncbi:MAG: helix-turn-helix domain-containing protein, partial [Bacteroidota bacterium]
FIFEYVMIGALEIFIFVLMYRVFLYSSFREVIGAPSYENNPRTTSDFEGDAFILNETMNEKQPFLDSDLTLNGLSSLSGIGSNRLSQLFSLHYQSSFYDFVNTHRIKHVEKLLEDSENNKFTITAIAEMSGFKSKTTFYKAFKAKHGMTPVKYLEMLQHRRERS